MKRIFLVLVTMSAWACRCRPAEEAPPLVGGPPRLESAVETVLEAPPGTDDFGRYVAIVSPAGGEATVAYTWRGVLYACRSDRARHAWLPPTKVADVGDGSRPFSLALDTSNGLLGVAYSDQAQSLRIATSKDSGLKWQSERLAPGRDPSLAMARGRAFVTWVDEAGAHYADGRADDPATWRPMSVPAKLSETAPVVGVDARGEPGVAWAAGAPLDVFFWRPTAPRILVLRTGAVSSSCSLALAFKGARPTIALRAGVGGSYGLWMLTAADAGRTWGQPSRVGDDGDMQPQGDVQLALSANGQLAVATQTTEPYGEDSLCGWPKVARGNDPRQLRLCSPVTDGQLGRVSPSLAFDGERLIVAVTNLDRDARPPGIYVWREARDRSAMRDRRTPSLGTTR